MLVDVEVDWLVVKDPGDVRLAHEGLVMSRDVVEECWCLTIALVSHEGCHGCHDCRDGYRSIGIGATYKN